jgi:dsDNA-binding SOS-regulon protein
MKFNIELINGQVLKEIYLSTSKELGDTIIKTKDDFFKALYGDRLYYTGKYIQGTISTPKAIKNYDIIEDDIELEKTLKNYVNKNTGIFEDYDRVISDFILNNKENLAKILKKDENSSSDKINIPNIELTEEQLIQLAVGELLNKQLTKEKGWTEKEINILNRLAGNK